MTQSAGDGITPRASGMTTRSFMRRVVYPVVVILAIVGVIWLIEDQRGGSGTSSSGTAYGAREIDPKLVPEGLQVGAKEGQVAPDFELENLAGGESWLTDFRGHPVVLNFWATWCQPCRQEMPQLVTAYDKDKANGIVIIGLNLQEGKDQITPFAQERGIDYPILIDRDGDVGNEYGLLGLPTTYFIDANGVIQSIYRGPLQDTQNDTNVQGAIGETDLQQRIAQIMAIQSKATGANSGGR